MCVKKLRIKSFVLMLCNQPDTAKEKENNTTPTINRPLVSAPITHVTSSITFYLSSSPLNPGSDCSQPGSPGALNTAQRQRGQKVPTLRRQYVPLEEACVYYNQTSDDFLTFSFRCSLCHSLPALKHHSSAFGASFRLEYSC